MSNFQICLCGSAPGYPHHPCCPRPCFRDSDPTWSAVWTDNLVQHCANLTAELARAYVQLEDLKVKTLAVRFQHRQGEMI